MNPIAETNIMRANNAGIDFTCQSSRVSTVAAGSPVYYVIGSSGLTDLHVSAARPRTLWLGAAAHFF